MQRASGDRKWLISVLKVALLAIVVFLVGCGPETQQPMRVLAPTIRTEDLVRWVDEAGIDRSKIDWIAVDAAHDRYLDSVLRNRIVARERITVAYRPIDEEEITPGDKTAIATARIYRTALAANRDFTAQLTGEDLAFFNELGSVRGLDHTITGYFSARRSLQRTSERFLRAPFPAGVAKRFVAPIDLVLGAWPQNTPRPTSEIIAWTNSEAPQLSLLADRWWESIPNSTVAIFNAIGQKRHSPIKAEFDAETTRVDRVMEANNAKVRAASVEYLRAATQVLGREMIGIPASAQESARDQVIESLTTIQEYGPTLASFRAVSSMTGLPAQNREQAAKICEAWRTNHQQLVLQFSDDPKPQMEAANRAREQLLALVASDDTKMRILKGYFQVANPAAQLDPIPESEDVLFYDASKEYRNWIRAGMISPAPTRATLRVIARMAQLDQDHEATFVQDALDDWRLLLENENKRISEAQKKVEKLGIDIIEDLPLFNRTLDMVVNDCIVLTNQHAAELDRRIGDTLADRALVFGGTAEPAGTVWRVLRTYPAIDAMAFQAQGPDESRAFSKTASASLGVLATDRKLLQKTRDVLVAILLANSDELLACATATDTARLASIRPMARSFLLARLDLRKAKSELNSALADFLVINNRWNELQQKLVDEAAEVLSDADAFDLRYRRTTLLEPEILLGTTTQFARDGDQARRLSGELLSANDRALARTLERDDLALVVAIRAATASDPVAQSSANALKTLYQTNELLAEQSLRRIDRAARAVRDSPSTKSR